MTVSEAKQSAGDLALADLIDEVMRAQQSGERPDLEAYVSNHPEHADQLRQLLPALELLADLSEAGNRRGRPDPVLADPSAVEGTPRPVQGMIGEYRVLREIGRGGMGVVYEAEQTTLRRRVALKVFPFAAVLDPRRLQRFQNEARAAAALKHPNIVGVYSVGCDRGVHYYAMEYVEGQTLAEVIQQGRGERDEERGERGEGRGTRDEGRGERDEGPDASSSITGHQPSILPPHPLTSSPPHPVTPSPPHPATETSPLAALSTDGSTRDPEFFRAVARLGIQAAEALEHAHGLGVVHRDIKPSNLMVESRLPSPARRRSDEPALPSPSGRGAGGEGRRGEGPHLWITDFGLAMTQTDTNLTMTGDVLGTLRYMSPEQVEAKHGVLDHRTDVYSLGITLYELLTLQPGFPGDDRQKLIRQVAEGEPPRPRQLNHGIPRDLETIVLKATAKEPHCRYTTAGELANDLRRFQEDKPIRARRPSLVQRAARWSRRYRWVIITAAAAIFVGLSVGLALTWHQKQQKASQYQRAERNLQLALEAVDDVYLRFADKNYRDFRGDPQQETLTPEGKAFLEKALRFYQQFAEANRGEPSVRLETAKAYTRVGRIRSRLGMRAEALADCDRALEIANDLLSESPNLPKYRKCAAEAYCSRGYLRRMRALPRGRFFRFSLLSRINLNYTGARPDPRATSASAREVDEALVDFTEAIRLDPNDARAYSGRGDVHEDKGAYDKALADWSQAIRLEPERPEYYNNRGMIYFRRREYDKAIADLTEAIRRAPNAPGYSYQRGILHDVKGDLDSAIADFSEAIRRDPKGAKWYCDRGGVYLRKGEPDKAIADFTEAIRVAPKWDRPYRGRGWAYLKKGEHEKALAEFKEATRLNPASPDAVASLAQVYSQQGDLQKALDAFEVALAAYPESALACNDVAWFLVSCPDSRFLDVDRALKLAGKAVEGSPKNADCWNTLGVARYRAGQWKPAIEALEKAAELRRSPHGADWFFLAMAHWQVRNQDQARELYEKAVKWMQEKEYRRENDELRRFRAEAAELLGMTCEPAPQKANQEAKEPDEPTAEDAEARRGMDSE